MEYNYQSANIELPATWHAPATLQREHAGHTVSANRQDIVKRMVDITISFLLIIGLLSWITIILLPVICFTSRGPLLFRQKRRTRNRRVFTCYKFRTLRLNDEADTLPSNELDARITSVGHWLRRTHIDELPQLVNVLMGDMSLVGPRPFMLSEDEHFSQSIPFYNQRYGAKAGMTGLAQSYGKFGSPGKVNSIRERVALDNYYVRHRSFITDLRILVRTLRQAL
jgi:putative colanic acid biosynthesis UDP-glucose lipid carrier transferase